MSFFRKKQYLVLLSDLGGQNTTNNGNENIKADNNSNFSNNSVRLCAHDC